MREQPSTTLIGNSRGNRRSRLLLNRAGLAQQSHRSLEPCVQRGQFRIGSDLFLQRCDLVRRQLAHEQRGDADFEFFAG